MNASQNLRNRLTIALAVASAVALILGVLLERSGFALPESLLALLGSETSFGAMAKIGGGIAMAALVLMALDRQPADTPVPAARPAPEDPVAPRSGAFVEGLDSLQMRLARRATGPTKLTDAATDPLPRQRLAARLQRGALVLVTAALAALVAAAAVSRLVNSR